MIALVKNNFGLKLFAFAIAVSAWGYFHLAAAPGTTAHFDQEISVPIVVSGLHSGLQATFKEKDATVVVELPRNGTALRRDQIQAELDATDLFEPGYHNVAVKVVAPDVAIKRLSPASVIVHLDRVEDRVVPVAYDYVGERRGIVVDSASLVPSTTTIRGTTSDLARVQTVRVEIPIPTAPQQLDAMIRPTPTDPTGGEVSDVQVSPNLVRVRVRFVRTTGAQTVQKEK